MATTIRKPVRKAIDNGKAEYDANVAACAAHDRQQYLIGLLSHPSAVRMIDDHFGLFNQGSVDDQANPHELVQALVLVEAIRALKREAGLEE